MCPKMRTEVKVAVAAIILSLATAKSVYERKETCKTACVYDYILSGEMHDKRGKAEIEVTAEVTLHCESVGTYDDEPVKYYCIDVKEARTRLFEVQTNETQYDSDVNDTVKHQRASADLESTMKKRFCFIRNEKGRVLSVFYPHYEENDVINYKKTITSAFQANFAKTETEEETDSQSKHTSHYTYSEEGNRIIEHRSVSGKDVSKYSGKNNEEKLDYQSEEDIEVDENKIIHYSHGESTTSQAKNADPEEDEDDEDSEGADADIPPIEAKSFYTLELKHCQAPPTKNIEYDINTARSIWEKEPIADTLMATLDERKLDQLEMNELYDGLPDLVETVRRAARSTDKNNTRNKIKDAHLAKWRRILHLESQHGPLDGRTPKIHYLRKLLEENLLKQSEEHKQLRIMLYSLLSSEGSLMAQKALLNALQVITDVEEYDNIVIDIAMLQSAHISTVSNFKELINSYGTIDKQLLLAFSTLGRHRNVEHEVVGMITKMLLSSSTDAFTNTSELIFLIHALGNTGSKLIIPYISPFLLSSNNDIQQASIDALRTVSIYEGVQKLFTEVINNNASIETLLAIVESLIFPYESFTYFPERVKLSDDQVTDRLMEMIVNASIDFEDYKLYSIIKKYLKYHDTDKSVELLNRLQDIHHHRVARTTNWESTNNDYNVIASYSSRVSDTTKYPYHKAYLWRKKLGPSKVHARLTVGGFGGVGSTGLKIFGKGVISLHAFGRTYEAVKVEYKNCYEIAGSHYPFRFVKIAGSTQLNRYSAGNGLTTWSRSLHGTRVFNVEFRVWVWIGHLNFYIEGTVNIDVSLDLNLGTKEANAEVDFGPTFSITGGSSYTILRNRIGLEIKASIGYYVTPRASAALCDQDPKADATACFGVMHGSKGINVDVYAYYQRKACKIKRWRIKCDWKPKKKLSLLSSSFSLGFLSQSLLWGKCAACFCSGDLHSYCSSSTPWSIGNVPGASNCNCYTTTSYA